MDAAPKTGLVLGKFMPPHMGHVYLVEFARAYVERLAIVMDSLPSQPIPGPLRLNWLRELFPQCDVFHLERMPQEPSEHPEFWELWRETLYSTLPFRPDCVFASESYGWRLARELSATFVPVDCDREAVAISGTQVRDNPFANWQHLPRCVRPYFLKRVCVFGPESTGKTTLARELARHYSTVCVPEFARTLLEQSEGKIEQGHIPMIARGQLASEEALARNANRLLICDTDVLLTTIWSEVLYGDCPGWIRQAADQHSYDLYLLTGIDIPWVADLVRYLPATRQAFWQRCLDALQSTHRPFVRIEGDSRQRFEAAVAAIDRMLDGE